MKSKIKKVAVPSLDKDKAKAPAPCETRVFGGHLCYKISDETWFRRGLSIVRG